ncbi:unnamed protein product, partial [Durusdinium trenchii]
VDPCRIYVTGLSLGASGSWHLALRYGQYLAGLAPVSGVCHWPHGAWPKGGGNPLPEVLERLANLPVRAYQIDVDRYAGSPVKDFEWLCWGLKEEQEDLNLCGMEVDRRVDVAVRRWSRDDGQPWELWQAKGPLKDWKYYDGWDGDKHCLWNRVYPFPEWGMAAFFKAHQVPKDKCWNVEVASDLSTMMAKQKAEEAAWNTQQEAKRAKEEMEAAQEAVPMEVDQGQLETLGKMSTGDMEVMQEQKRLRQDEELEGAHAVAA